MVLFIFQFSLVSNFGKFINFGPNFFMFQVLFAAGVKVELERNRWGIDVTVYTPRAEKRADEEGLCLYDGTTSVNTFGSKQRRDTFILDFKLVSYTRC